MISSISHRSLTSQIKIMSPPPTPHDVSERIQNLSTLMIQERLEPKEKNAMWNILSDFQETFSYRATPYLAPI